MESNIRKHLQTLKALQKIDSQLDETRALRGALPEEAQDLEDEIAGLNTRKQKYDEEINTQEKEISTHKNKIKEAEAQIETYEEQQLNVRNNREYDAISKEIEYQQLEIQYLEQKNKKVYQLIEEIKNAQAAAGEKLKEKQNLLKEKELNKLTLETKLQEEALNAEREKVCKDVEERLLRSYGRIRANARNGLAVVSIQRGACGGCFNVVPPQRQAEVREHKKILVCEHCGRILCDVIQDDSPPTEKKKKVSRKKAAPKSTKKAAPKSTKKAAPKSTKKAAPKSTAKK